jgi:prepilin-type N-terminal cleavage/methylation domain-containing protein
MAAREIPNVRPAFSLLEVLVSLTILGMAASALLLATGNASQTATDAIATSTARGIAEQILDHIVGLRYTANGESSTVLPLGTEAGESGTPLRTILFDDTDDFHGINQTPLLDPWGSALGQGNAAGGLRPTDFRVADSYFSNWRVAVSITYVDPNNPAIDLTGTATSGMRAATVTVSRTSNGVTETLAQLRRVFSYVPTL